MSFASLFRSAPAASPQHAAPTTLAEEQAQLNAAIEASKVTAEPGKGVQIDPECLLNLGSTCWFNAILQAIFKTSSVHYDLLEAVALQEVSADLPLEMKTHLEAQKRRAIQLIEILTLSAIGDPAKELYEKQKVLQEELGETFPETKIGTQRDVLEMLPLIYSFFGIDNQLPTFTLQTHIRQVEDESFRLSPAQQFASISLSSGGSSIQECIKNQFMQPVSVEAELKTEYLTSDLPQYLTFEMKRFKVSYAPDGTQIHERLNEDIHVDEEIRLPIYNAGGTCVEKVITMRLVTVIAHQSRDYDHGHYVSYQLLPNGTYRKYNDSKVSLLTVAEGKAATAKEGYVAVYEFASEQEPVEGEFETIKTIYPPREEAAAAPQPPAPATPEPAASPVEAQDAHSEGAPAADENRSAAATESSDEFEVISRTGTDAGKVRADARPMSLAGMLPPHLQKYLPKRHSIGRQSQHLAGRAKVGFTPETARSEARRKRMVEIARGQWR